MYCVFKEALLPVTGMSEQKEGGGWSISCCVTDRLHPPIMLPILVLVDYFICI